MLLWIGTLRMIIEFRGENHRNMLIFHEREELMGKNF